jgi:uncharacterized membrane protein YcaP (DUF421 family)
MFEIGTPVAELILRAAIVYLVLLALVRISGKRTVGEFTPFDLLVVILLGESAQAGLSGKETSLWGTIVPAATLVALNLLAAMASARSRAALTLLEGEPVLLARRGKLFEKALRSNHVPRNDLDEAIRKANLGSLDEVELAMLETSGDITIVPKDRK